MTRFVDGPAMGKTLMLKRAPIFLRVVEVVGKIDALDQLKDEPDPAETVHVYKITGKPGFCHVNLGYGKGGSYPLAEYALYELQPTEAEMRSNELWSAWCLDQQAAGATHTLEGATQS